MKKENLPATEKKPDYAKRVGFERFFPFGTRRDGKIYPTWRLWLVRNGIRYVIIVSDMDTRDMVANKLRIARIRLRMVANGRTGISMFTAYDEVEAMRYIKSGKNINQGRRVVPPSIIIQVSPPTT